MEYQILIESLRRGLCAEHPEQVEVVSLPDRLVEVRAAQLMRTQHPEILQRHYARDYLFVGLTSELPPDPALAPHDCLCVADAPLPPGYGPGMPCNLVLLHTADQPDALMMALNHAAFCLSDDARYYWAKEQLTAAERRGVDLSEALRLVGQLMSNPIVLVTERGDVLGTGDDAFSIAPLQEEIQQGLLRPETFRKLHQEDVYGQLLEGDRLEKEELAWQRGSFLCIPVRIQGLRVAELIVQNWQTAFHYAKIRLCEDVARLLAGIINRQREANNDQTLLHNLLFSALLQARPSQRTELEERIGELRWQQMPGMRLLCCVESTPGGFERLKLAHPRSRWTAVGHYWMLLLYPEAQLLPRLEEELAQDGLRGGLSWPFDRLLDMPYALTQAQAALRSGGGGLTDYSTVFAAHIFALPPEEAIHHLHPAVRLLADYDRNHEGNLLETLEAYLCGSEQTAEIAARLYISRSALFYRIRRIRELCNVELAMGEERMNLLLSLRLLRTLEEDNVT